MEIIVAAAGCEGLCDFFLIRSRTKTHDAVRLKESQQQLQISAGRFMVFQAAFDLNSAPGPFCFSFGLSMTCCVLPLSFPPASGHFFPSTLINHQLPPRPRPLPRTGNRFNSPSFVFSLSVPRRSRQSCAGFRSLTQHRVLEEGRKGKKRPAVRQ